MDEKLHQAELKGIKKGTEKGKAESVQEGIGKGKVLYSVAVNLLNLDLPIEHMSQAKRLPVSVLEALKKVIGTVS